LIRWVCACRRIRWRREFLSICGFPVAAPSANRSGRPSPTTWRAVQRDLEGRITCLLKGPRATVGLESTVVDCTGRVPVVLRPGAITLEQLRAVVPGTRAATARDVKRGRSPGLRHRHYAPEAKLVIRDQCSVISEEERGKMPILDCIRRAG
jgi:L-threonylcarbamoyladenylate synthase